MSNCQTRESSGGEEIYNYLTGTQAELYRGGSGESRRERNEAEWASDVARGGADPMSGRSHGGGGAHGRSVIASPAKRREGNGGERNGAGEAVVNTHSRGEHKDRGGVSRSNSGSAS